MKQNGFSSVSAAVPAKKDWNDMLQYGHRLNEKEEMKACLDAGERLIESLLIESFSKNNASQKKRGRPKIHTQDLADKFMNVMFTDSEGNKNLAHFKGRFYIYNGRYYVESPTGSIIARITAFLRKKHRKSDFSFTRSLVGNILLNIEAADCAGIVGDHKIPFWKPKTDDMGQPEAPAEDAENLILMKNGILPLNETVSLLKKGKELDGSLLRPLTPKLFSTFGLDYAFCPAAECPKWLRYLQGVQPDESARELLQMMFGLALIPETKYNQSFWLIGEPGSGKSVCLHVLEHFIGKHNFCCVPLGHFDNKFSLHPLTTKLLNIVGEQPTPSDKKGLHAVEGIFKDACDGGTLPIEQKYCDPQSGKAIARNVFAANELPLFADKTSALWDRINIILFNIRFRKTKKR